MSSPLFSTLPLSRDLLQVVEELGYKSLTPIQAQSIPHLLQGLDLIGQSKTGSGKTAAFSLPILHKLDTRDRHIQCLILSPTRELCTQVAREIRKLGRRHAGLQVLILSGGLPIYPQLTALEKGVHLIVGTPGRVLDHLRRGTLDLNHVETFVLDEADRMLEMGFQEDMAEIVSHLPPVRQTVLFSATFPRQIESLSRNIQKKPLRVTIEDESAAHSDITERYLEVAEDKKYPLLVSVLRQENPESAIVFCNLKATVAKVAMTLTQLGVSVDALHGDLEQSDRDRIMAKFRNGSIRILVATDVAARGLDVENLSLVINYDLPSDPEIYTHRIGRTGRAGNKGAALSFATSRQIHKFNLEADEAPLDIPSDRNFAYPEAKMQTLYVAGGRKEKVRPGDILGALTGDAGVDGTLVGKIEIHDRFSYVAVSREISKVAWARLNQGKIKGRHFRVEFVR